MGIYEDVALLQEQMLSVQNNIATMNTTMQDIAVAVDGLQEYRNYKAIQPNADLNDLAPGHYFITDTDTCLTIANRPDTTGQTAAIDVMRAGNTGQLIMIYQPCIKELNKRYVRTYYANTWGPWLVTDLTDSGWINLPLNTGWTMNDYTSEIPQYRKIGNRVFLRGLVNATAAADRKIATLPTGFAPSRGWYNRFNCVLNQSQYVNVQVNANGEILDYTKTTSISRSFLSLNGISFLTD